jgi:hypothetical protein
MKNDIMLLSNRLYEREKEILKLRGILDEFKSACTCNNIRNSESSLKILSNQYES